MTKLKELRIEAGFKTQKSLVTELEIEDITNIRISQWETGAKPIPTKYIKNLCSVLNCSEEDLELGNKVLSRMKREVDVSEVLHLKANLTSIMAEKNINQKELASRMNTTKQYVSDILSRLDSPMSIKTAQKIAEALKVDLKELSEMPLLGKRKLQKARAFLRAEDDLDFEKVWELSKKSHHNKPARQKILIMEDSKDQMMMYHQIIKNKLKSFKIANVMIQQSDKVQVGTALINAEEEDMKLVVMDMNLSDTSNSLKYLSKNIDNQDCKIIVISAVSDKDEIEEILNNPIVSGLIKKGSSDPREWMILDNMLMDLFKS